MNIRDTMDAAGHCLARGTSTDLRLTADYIEQAARQMNDEGWSYKQVQMVLGAVGRAELLPLVLSAMLDSAREART